MKLIELLSASDENSNFYVVNSDGYLLTWYDGKNSIDEIYNECEVIKINTFNNGVRAYIGER